jgi:hypothetical protein
MLAACSGGGEEADPGPRRLQWTANRERGVNSPGGGYLVEVSGRGVFDVRYVSGAFAPTSLTTTLPSGNYTVSIRAYAADQGGRTSAPSTITVNVP